MVQSVLLLSRGSDGNEVTSLRAGWGAAAHVEAGDLLQAPLLTDVLLTARALWGSAY